MPAFGWKIKLRLKFVILLFLVAVLPLLVAMLIMLLRLQEIQRSNVISINRQIAATVAQEVNTFIVSQFDVLKNFGTIYPEFSDSNTKDTILERVLFNSENFVDLSIINSSGQEIARKNILTVVPSNELINRADSKEFKAVKEQGRYLGPVYLSEGKPYFTIGQQIKGVNNNFEGAVFAIVDARVMQEVVRKISAVGSMGRVFIVDSSSTLIAHPDISLVLAQTNFSFVPAVRTFTNPKEQAKPLEIYKNEQNQEVLGDGVPIRVNFDDDKGHNLTTGWLVVAEQPISVALTPVYQVTQFAIAMLLMVVIISILGSFLFTNSIVLPIEKIHTASRQIKEGNLNYRVLVQTGDEIEDLANEFNNMAAKLSEYIQNIQMDKQIITGEKNKLAVTLSGITDAVIAVDREGKIIIFNKAAQLISGVPEHEALGKPIDDLIRFYDSDQRLNFVDYFPLRIGGPEEIVFSKKGLKIVGHKTAFVDMIVGQIKIGASGNLGGILTLHDIGREKELEGLKLDFVAMTAHELRTPLTSLKGYLSVFNKEIKGKLDKTESFNLNRIRISAQEISQLVENLLNVSRIERGVFAISLEPMNLIDIINKKVADFEERAIDKKIDLNFVEPKNESIIVKADELRIGEVLSNLLSNAINFTHPRGQIKIWTEIKDQSAIIHVSDTGEGIGKDSLPRLFTKFFKTSGILEHGSKGTGLGLYISKKIIDLHQGKIWAKSELGKGSTFSFSLPLA